MTTLTEPYHAGEFVVSLANNTRSLETVTLKMGEDLGAGTVLGRIAVGAATSAAFAINAANTGTMGAVTVGAGAVAGDYKLVVIEPASNAGKFTVENPSGVLIGTGTVAAAFSAGGLSFTLADGATDFLAGEGFTITVAAGSGKYVAFDQDATDGSQHAAAILFRATDATDGDRSALVVARQAEVKGACLVWPSDIDAGEKTAALADLAALTIIAR